MSHLTALLVLALAAVALAQFPNGRILEPPVPSLCVQRVVHERYADSKFLIHIFKRIIYRALIHTNR